MPVIKSDTPVWDKPDPTKTENHLSKKKKASAKARARAAGRPYPNLIDNMAVSKGARLDKLASSRAGKRYLKDAPLKENEFYHGTTSDSAKKIKSEGFRLANPKEKVIRSEQQRSKTGRPISALSNKNHLGPGVYLTRSKYYASSYPQHDGFFLGQDRQKGLKDKSKSAVLRVAVPKNSKFMPSDMGRQGRTPQATKAGYQGVADEYTRFEGNKGSRDMYAFANPKNVKVVDNRYRPTSQAGKDAAVVTAVGSTGYGASKVKKAIPRIPGQTSLFSAAEGGLTTPARRLPTEGHWKHLSGQTTPIRIVGPHPTIKDHFNVVDHQDIKRALHRNQIAFIKPKNVSKSMEYSVTMNQSRFGGASAVGKSFELVEKELNLQNGTLIAGGAAGMTMGAANIRGAKQFKQDAKHKTEIARRMALNEKEANKLRNKIKLAGLHSSDPDVFLFSNEALKQADASLNLSSARRIRMENSAKASRLSHVRVKNIGRGSLVAGTAALASGAYGAVKKAEQQYDQMGNPVPARKPLMSGNAKLGAAGTGIGLAGVKRIADAGTLPSRLQGQSDAMASKVKFQERLANDQIQRVQNANQIPNRFTRRKQVNLTQYYSDKAQGHLADARAKQVVADNALKTAPAKKLAHLKSGAGLVATGGVMGGLAVYNNAKDRKNKAQAK